MRPTRTSFGVQALGPNAAEPPEGCSTALILILRLSRLAWPGIPHPLPGPVTTPTYGAELIATWSMKAVLSPPLGLSPTKAMEWTPAATVKLAVKVV